MKIALTGGIACGKSLVAKFLNEYGVETLDADDVVHELIPADERKRLAAKVFADPEARCELEARIHPLVKARIKKWIESGTEDKGRKADEKPETQNRKLPIRVAIIPLLFEVRWESEFDIILCVTSEKAVQVSRMMTSRGYSREEAEARLAAQLPVADKAAKSHYVIENAGSAEDLRAKVAGMVEWLKRKKTGISKLTEK